MTREDFTQAVAGLVNPVYDALGISTDEDHEVTYNEARLVLAALTVMRDSYVAQVLDTFSDYRNAYVDGLFAMADVASEEND